MTNPNENNLVSFQCPECRSYGPFRIEITTTVLMDDEYGTIDEGSHRAWDEDSDCRCDKCDFDGTVKDFKITKGAA